LTGKKGRQMLQTKKGFVGRGKVDREKDPDEKGSLVRISVREAKERSRERDALVRH